LRYFYKNNCGKNFLSAKKCIFAWKLGAQKCSEVPKLSAKKCINIPNLNAEKCIKVLKLGAEKCVKIMQRLVIQQFIDWKNKKEIYHKTAASQKHA